MAEGVVRIGEREIGEGRPLFIVAEVGTTMGGDVKVGLALIEAAKEAGADAIKPILTDPEGLIADKTLPYTHETFQGLVTSNLFQLLNETRIEGKDWNFLKRRAEDLGLVFYLTVDTPLGLKLSERWVSPPCYKLSSWDLRNAPLIWALAQAGKPVQVDLGPAVIGEVFNVVNALGDCPVILLHATHTKRPSDFNMMAISCLKRNFPECPVGWSNDGRDEMTDLLALGQGVSIIEKRLTLDRRSGKGHHHFKSLEPGEFKLWADRMRVAHEMLGRDGLYPSFEDVLLRDIHYTSLRVGRDVRLGEVLSKEDFVAKRPGAGISPFYAYLFEAKVAVRDLKENQAIQWEDVTSDAGAWCGDPAEGA